VASRGGLKRNLIKLKAYLFGWWPVLIRAERKVLWLLVVSCSEIKVLLLGG
jgi:hypothetical protein